MSASHLTGQAKINQRSKMLVAEFKKDKYSPLIYGYPSVFRFSEVVKHHSGKSAQDCILLELTIPPDLRTRIEAGEEDLKMLARCISADIVQRYREHVTVDSIFYNYYDRLTIFYHHRSRFSPVAMKKVYSKGEARAYHPSERKKVEKQAWSNHQNSSVGAIGGFSDSGFDSEKQQGDLVAGSFDGNSIVEVVLRTSTQTQTETPNFEERKEASEDGKKEGLMRMPEPVNNVDNVNSVNSRISNVNSNTEEGESQNRAKSISSNRNEIEIDYVKVEASMKKNIMLSKFRENESFNRSRAYLAYFSKYKDTCYEGETFLSVQTYLRNEGMFLDQDQFEQNYYEFLSDYGFTKIEIDKDLENLHHQMCTNRILRIDRITSIKQGSLTGDRRAMVPTKTGSMDPECCVLM